MMLRCLSTWVKREDQGFIRIRGDAQEVLAALAKRAAKSPLLNEVTKEAALHLAVHFASLEALQRPGMNPSLARNEPRCTC